LIAGVASEVALLAAALALAWYLDISPFYRLRLDAAAILYGLLATAPMLVLLRWCLRTTWGPIRRLVATVEQHLRPYLRHATVGGIVLLSLTAGVAEEILFRGVIQTGLESRVPAAAAVVVAALLFGLAHWLTLTYAVLAGLIGAYLGAVYVLTDNLLAPIVAHSTYDAVALWILARMKPVSDGIVGGEKSPPNDPDIAGGRPMTVTQAHSPGTFCWAELATSDSQAGKRFYTGLFGWTFEDRPIGENEFYTMFESGGKQVGALYQLAPQQVAEGVPPNWLSYLAVDSADRSAARARELGAEVIAEPFDVFEYGRMGVIKDPTGAVFGLWEAKSHTGFGVVGEPNSYCWNELCTRDPAGAVAFYTGLAGWGSRREPMADFVYTYFTQGEQNRGGMMEIAAEWGPMPPHWMVYFAVDDCDAKAALAETLGGKVLMPPTDVPGVGRFAQLQDPQGAAFSIVQLLPNAA
jgi:predicted enzyme related to lactoylglutathione lyase/membrane protease YdiL (CAAX protease family)